MRGEMHPYSTDSTERVRILWGILALSIPSAYLLHIITTKVLQLDSWWIETPSVFGIAGAIYWVFDNWLWRLRIFRQLGIVRVPDLNGEWEVDGQTSYEEASSGERKRFKARVKIKQSWTRIQVLLETDSSMSHSLSASILVNEARGAELTYMYFNEPKAGAPNTLVPHRGTAWLIQKDEDCLEGEYYTGRGRQNFGTLTLRRQQNARRQPYHQLGV